MELSSWPQIAPINQKNYYTYVCLFCQGEVLRIKSLMLSLSRSISRMFSDILLRTVTTLKEMTSFLHFACKMRRPGTV
jgi:hypothetical protein